MITYCSFLYQQESLVMMTDTNGALFPLSRNYLGTIRDPMWLVGLVHNVAWCYCRYEHTIKPWTVAHEACFSFIYPWIGLNSSWISFQEELRTFQDYFYKLQKGASLWNDCCKYWDFLLQNNRATDNILHREENGCLVKVLDVPVDLTCLLKAYMKKITEWCNQGTIWKIVK